MSARIRIKLGHLEVEYEGDAAFLKSDLLETIEKLSKLQKAFPIAAPPPGNEDIPPEPSQQITHSTTL